MKERQECKQDAKRWFGGHTGRLANVGRGRFRHTVIKNSQSSTAVDQKLKGNLPVKSCQNWHTQHAVFYKNPRSCTGNEWLELRCCCRSFCCIDQLMLIGCGRWCWNWKRHPTPSVKFTFPSPLSVPFVFHHCHSHPLKQVLFLSCTLSENLRVSGTQDHAVRTSTPTHFQKLNLSPSLQPWPANGGGGRSKPLAPLHWAWIWNFQHAIH